MNTRNHATVQFSQSFMVHQYISRIVILKVIGRVATFVNAELSRFKGLVCRTKQPGISSLFVLKSIRVGFLEGEHRSTMAWYRTGPQPGNLPEIFKNIFKAPKTFQLQGKTTSCNHFPLPITENISWLRPLYCMSHQCPFKSQEG